MSARGRHGSSVSGGGAACLCVSRATAVRVIHAGIARRGSGGTAVARAPRPRAGDSSRAPSRQRRRPAFRRRPPTPTRPYRSGRLPRRRRSRPGRWAPGRSQLAGWRRRRPKSVGTQKSRHRIHSRSPVSGGRRFAPVRWMVRVGAAPAGVGRRSPRPRTRRPDGSSTTPGASVSHNCMVAISLPSALLQGVGGVGNDHGRRADEHPRHHLLGMEQQANATACASSTAVTPRIGSLFRLSDLRRGAREHTQQFDEHQTPDT